MVTTTQITIKPMASGPERMMSPNSHIDINVEYTGFVAMIDGDEIVIGPALKANATVANVDRAMMIVR